MSSSDAYAPLLVAHRGSPHRAPENTIASFERAAAEGARCIEVDVRLARDRVPVVIHDATLRRTTGMSGYVSAHGSSDLARMDAGAWFAPQFTGCMIPTLDALLAWRPKHVKVMLELKVGALSGETAHALAESVLSRVHAAEAASDVIITSFSHAVLRAARQEDDAIELGQLQYGPRMRVGLLRRLERIRASWFIRSVRTISSADVTSMHDVGIQVAVYTANTEREFRHAAGCGVDAIITNELPHAQAWFQESR